MISKNKIREIQQLEKRKAREERRLFVGEGPKVVSDLMETFEPVCIVATDDCAAEWERRALAERREAEKDKQAAAGKAESKQTPVEIISVSDDELRKVSFLQHPQKVLAVFRMPAEPEALLDEAADAGKEPNSKASTAEGGLKLASLLEPDALSLALDGVQDPGNMGTIIRIADWFGIRRIYSSFDTADHYSPKVVQATMGSLARVSIIRTTLPELLAAASAQKIPVYGTFLDGENIYGSQLSGSGIIVMGNEGRGISDEAGSFVSRRISIPRFAVPSSASSSKSEERPCGAPDSLNVAIATAITVSEFRRQQSLLFDAIKDNGLRL